MSANPDQWIATLKKCEFLPETDLRQLCDISCELLLEESNVQPVKSPVVICGDIHGQFYDLLELFRTGGEIPSTSYIFMGDFVDRGYYSLETFSLLLALKCRYPDSILLLRGNHESRQITQVYGFYEECYQKYNNHKPWHWFVRVFDYLIIAALVDNSLFCVHGGLSPKIRTLDQIRTLERCQEIPHQGSFCDLLWSDPEEVKKWKASPRGAGWLFGASVTSEFNQLNNLKLIARAHQLVQEGHKFHFSQNLVTVWSAPNYCYRCGNVASILHISENGSRSFTSFEAVPDEKRKKPAAAGMRYFL